MKPPKANILIVDDDRMSLMILKNVVSNLNVKVIEAHNGVEALEKAEQNDLALALMDVEMPEMSGINLIKALRKTERHKHLPVIFVSGAFGEDQGVIRSITAGAIDFIPKPPNPFVLKGKVKLFLNMYYQKQQLQQLISDYEQANKELGESEERFRTLALNLHDALFLLNENGRVILWNRAAVQVFGYEEVEALNKFGGRLIPFNENYEKLKTEFRAFLKEDENNLDGDVRELSGLTKDGKLIPLEVSFSALPISGTKSLVVLAKDIRERLKAEDERLKAKELKSANKLMQEFLDNINHELRTPLNGIIGISKNLQKNGNDDSRMSEGLSFIQENGEKLLNSVNKILMFQSQARNSYIHFSISELTKRLSDFASRFNKSETLEFSIHVAENTPMEMFSDKNKIYQVLLNLIENALKFTDKGSVKLSISEDLGHYCFEISDTGIGIAEEKLEDIFKSFVQADGSNTRKTGGLGIGLSLTNKLVQELNGDLMVVSQEGKGSRFTLKVPIIISD